MLTIMKNKIVVNENRCRYCREVIHGLNVCECGGRQRDVSIWVQNTHRAKKVEKGRGGYKCHKKNGKN
ncbi:MAG: hypothetical protein ABIH82_03935 [Candidatus Woesearchaeota archaeon]